MYANILVLQQTSEHKRTFQDAHCAQLEYDLQGKGQTLFRGSNKFLLLHFEAPNLFEGFSALFVIKVEYQQKVYEVLFFIRRLLRREFFF